jgi:MFS family permease
VHFERLGNAGGLGATMTGLAAGMMVGAFSYGLIARRFSRFTILRGVMIGVAVAAAPMAALPPTPVFIVIGFSMGMLWGPFNPLWNTLIQNRVPAEMQGRVYGVQMSALYAAPPLGQLVVGLAVEQFGLQQTFVVIAALFVAVALLTVSLRSLRDLNTDTILVRFAKRALGGACVSALGTIRDSYALCCSTRRRLSISSRLW